LYHENGNDSTTINFSPILLPAPATHLSDLLLLQKHKHNYIILPTVFLVVHMNSLLQITSIVTNIEDPVVLENPNFLNTLYEHEFLQPQLLTNGCRLQEIYDLRLNVWEHSRKSDFVNRKLYPNGWYDHLDKSAFHWIVTSNQNKIIASARLNIFNSLEDFPYYLAVKDFLLPEIMPFAFFSRLVVHPHYRQNGLSRKLFMNRTSFCEERGISWSQVFINNPLIIQQFKKSGYKNVGQANVSYHPLADPHPVNVFVKEN